MNDQIENHHPNCRCDGCNNTYRRRDNLAIEVARRYFDDIMRISEKDSQVYQTASIAKHDIDLALQWNMTREVLRSRGDIK